MNSKHTWIWLALAGGLLGLIFLVQRQHHKAPAGPARLMPELRAAEVTALEVRVGTNPTGIRVERTNNTWRLTQPLDYPAQPGLIDSLLGFLERLTPGSIITENELRSRPGQEAEYGFAPPQAALLLEQGGRGTRLLLGTKTAPGDQVYVQVVKTEGIYAVDSALLKFLPHSTNDWRDTTLMDFEPATLTWIAVTNQPKTRGSFVLQREPAKRVWRMVSPLPARADNARLLDALGKLAALRVQRFISDGPRNDWDALGLAPAELEFALGQGTNASVFLQFGSSPTNDPTQVYGRKPGQNTLFTVPRDLLEPWRASVNAFRDPHLLPPPAAPVQLVEVKGVDAFSLQAQTNGSWQVSPGAFTADPLLVGDFLSALTNLQVQFLKDAVNPPELPDYGLAMPVRQYVLKTTRVGATNTPSNAVLAELHFGQSTNYPGRVFARRVDADESSVYGMETNDFASLPAASWQLRDRRIWQFSPSDVVRVTSGNRGTTFQVNHLGEFKWSVAQGSTGIIEELALDQTVSGLAQLAAINWVAVGEQNRARFGFTEAGRQITLELKDGTKPSVEFGGPAPSGSLYAGVALDGQFWIFEFPWKLCRDVMMYLPVPNT